MRVAYVLKQSDMKALCIIDAYRDVDYIKIIRELVPGIAHAGAWPSGVGGIPVPEAPHLHGA